MQQLLVRKQLQTKLQMPCFCRDTSRVSSAHKMQGLWTTNATDQRYASKLNSQLLCVVSHVQRTARGKQGVFAVRSMHKAAQCLSSEYHAAAFCGPVGTTQAVFCDAGPVHRQ